MNSMCALFEDPRNGRQDILPFSLCKSAEQKIYVQEENRQNLHRKTKPTQTYLVKILMYATYTVPGSDLMEKI